MLQLYSFKSLISFCLLSQPVPAICIFICLLCLTNLFHPFQSSVECLLSSEGRKEMGTVKVGVQEDVGCWSEWEGKWGEAGRKAEFHVEIVA